MQLSNTTQRIIESKIEQERTIKYTIAMGIMCVNASGAGLFSNEATTILIKNAGTTVQLTVSHADKTKYKNGQPLA